MPETKFANGDDFEYAGAPIEFIRSCMVGAVQSSKASDAKRRAKQNLRRGTKKLSRLQLKGGLFMFFGSSLSILLKLIIAGYRNSQGFGDRYSGPLLPDYSPFDSCSCHVSYYVFSCT